MKDNSSEKETDDGDNAADVGDDGEGELVRVGQRGGVHVHQHGEVGEVVALTHGVRGVVAQHPAPLLRPRAAAKHKKVNSWKDKYRMDICHTLKMMDGEMAIAPS